jgi:hypothetical protein
MPVSCETSFAGSPRSGGAISRSGASRHQRSQTTRVSSGTSRAGSPRWLDNLSGDTSSDPPIVKIVRAKPADLQEGCWTRDPTPVQIVETQVRGVGQCEALYPSAPAPREVAGEPLVGDIIKCQLKAVDPADYRVSFSPTQWSRLESIFKSGVCDYTQPGQAQQPPLDTWLVFN